MADRTITLRIGANVTDALSKIRTLDSATRQWVNNNTAGVSTLSTGLLGIGAAVTAAVGVGVKKFADFDQAMSNVKAATMETTQNMGLLREAAIVAGADTQFSATEAAGAIENMGKAGVATDDILRGGLSGALDLAAASGMGVAEAGEAMATTLNQFKLPGTDAAHVADLLAAAAGKAMGEVSDMTGALKFVGPVANQMHIPLEQTVGVIAELAQQGILGFQAGTSLRGILVGLTSPSKTAADEMKRLGIEVYGANGQFVGLAGLAEQMRSKMENLTDAERDEAFGRMFGNEQITAARILYDGGREAVEKWTSAVNDSGYASEVASTKTDNLKGDIERLGGSIDSAFINSGTGANEALRTIVQGAEAVVDAIGNISPEALNAAFVIAGAGGLSALAVGGLGKIVVAVNNVRVAMAAMKISMSVAGGAAGLLSGAIALGAVVFADWAEGQQIAKQRTDDLKESLDQATGAITENTRATIFNDLEKSGWVNKAKAMGVALHDLVDAALDPTSAAMGRVKAATDAYVASAQAHLDAEMAVADGMGDTAGAATGLSDAIWAQEDLLKALGVQTGAVAASQVKWRDQQAAVLGTTANLTSAAQEQAIAAQGAQSAFDRFRGSQGAGISTTKEYTDALKDLIDAQKEAAGVALSDEEAQIRLEQAIDDATQSVKDNGRTLDITTDAGRANRSALLDIADASWAAVDAAKAHGASEDELVDKMDASRQAFVDAAVAAGMTTAEASALADELNLIPANVTTTFVVDDSQVQALLGLLSKPIYAHVAVGAGGAGGITRASGGILPGAPSSVDNMVIRAASGEFVVNARQTAKHRPLLEAINSGAPAYAAGGYVQPARYMSAPAYFPAAAPAPMSLVGLEISGTLDTPWGPSQMRGVVRQEMASAIRKAVR